MAVNTVVCYYLFKKGKLMMQLLRNNYRMQRNNYMILRELIDIIDTVNCDVILALWCWINIDKMKHKEIEKKMCWTSSIQNWTQILSFMDSFKAKVQCRIDTVDVLIVVDTLIKNLKIHNESHLKCYSNWKATLL